LVSDLNFQEENIPYTIKEAIKEAKRCLRCKNPQCVQGCPIDNDIPDFIFQLSKGNFGEARAIIGQKSNLPAVCGRVCPHELQCVGHCVLNKKDAPIQVGKLEQFVADFDYEMELITERVIAKSRGKIAVIGSGPAGLTVAGELAKAGFNVVVFEAEKEPGGILLYGIPEFRLSSEIVRREINKITSYGVSIIPNTMVGIDITIDEMFKQNFDAIFIGSGTALSRELDIKGKEKKGIISAVYFLRMVTLFNENYIERKAISVAVGDKVVVVGGGNVAMDTARTALRMGASSVTIVFHMKEEELNATKSEYLSTLEEGVTMSFSSNSVEFIGDEKITGLKVIKDGEEKIIEADKILIAIGSRPANRIVSSTEGIDIDDKGYVITKEKPYGMTTKKGVFAGGDVVHKPKTVVVAMKEAKKVAFGIAAYVDAVKLLDL